MCPITFRVVFMLGAGSSIAAGMPRTQQITDIVLSGEGVGPSSDGGYDIRPAGEVSPEIDRHNRMFLIDPVVDYINQLSDYYRCRRARLPNYEDLYYLAAQVRDAHSGVVDNPLVDEESEGIFQEVERREQCHAKRLSPLPCPPRHGW